MGSRHLGSPFRAAAGGSGVDHRGVGPGLTARILDVGSILSAEIRYSEARSVFLLLLLHILTMFVAVTLAAGTLLFVLVAARTGRTPAALEIAALPTQRFIPPAFILGGLFGLATGLAFGYNLLAPWLVIAYVLFVAATVWGIRVTSPAMRRLAKVAGAEGEAADAGDVERMLGRRLTIDAGFTFLVIGLIILDMVVKPFL